MPSNPTANQTRSTVFAFKCKMGTHLARIDFNLVLRTNEVKQLFFSEENNVHLVCMRLKENGLLVRPQTQNPRTVH